MWVESLWMSLLLVLCGGVCAAPVARPPRLAYQPVKLTEPLAQSGKKDGVDCTSSLHGLSDTLIISSQLLAVHIELTASHNTNASQFLDLINSPTRHVNNRSTLKDNIFSNNITTKHETNVIHTDISVAAIDCFECLSIDGTVTDCEDRFGPHNETGHLLSKDCRTGFLRFRASYCVKIKGQKKVTGEHLLIRTCSMDDWGTQCGDIALEQGPSRYKEVISGCLASCDFDGCNSARRHCGHASLWMLVLLALRN
ncbi:hypothetical protein CAPTEDRAFT_208143 [Capitella teleta]|uniref:Protein quiver n=1 Tax=Capitella teleta TaxID=283909 RepID=R7T8W4_CAPTE|nr:hypothetical protein CAPTEDRAFT_208143 [Capitella teleta]|eukprot:ELT87840.1 hypothetical protein CAPTEDRAFT_208143 [Capitella teleta]